MKLRITCVVAGFLSLVLSPVQLTFAQTPAQTASALPRLVRFGGTVKDLDGSPLTGVVGITFALYSEQTGGAALWLETQNVTADSNGHYTVLLGSTKPDGLPADLFTSEQARWLGVQVNGGTEQPRVPLLSVPYAMKAADAETVGGLPASAFVLAAPPTNMTSTAIQAGITPQPLVTGTTPVTTAGGTVNKLAKFDAKADITNSLIFDNGTNVGIGNSAPGAKLDVSGTGTFRGALSLPATGTANATAGKNSQPFNFTASAFNSGTAAAVNQTFRWQAEPVGNNSASPLGKLTLLFGSGTATPKGTGLSVSDKGIITFATGQTFPGGGGAGTVTSVALSAPSSDFTVSGSPVTGSGTLGLKWNVTPTSSDTANAIVKRDGTGSFSAATISAVVVNALGPPSGAAVMGSGGTGVLGQSTVTNGLGVDGEAQSGGTGVFGTVAGTTGVGVYGESFATSVDNFGVTPDGVHGTAHSSAGYGVSGNNVDPAGIGVFGQGGIAMYAAGNTGQSRTSSGWVKALVFSSGLNSGRVATCFNSTLTGANATTPPCGFTFTKAQTGDYIIDFGFEVDDRFFSVTPTYPDGVFVKACTDFTGSSCNNTLTANQAELTFSNSINVLVDTKFYLIVY